MATITHALAAAVSERFSNLRFPTLFLLLAGLFALDLVVPDFVPFVDEILLGLATLIVGNLTRRRDSAKAD